MKIQNERLTQIKILELPEKAQKDYFGIDQSGRVFNEASVTQAISQLFAQSITAIQQSMLFKQPSPQRLEVESQIIQYTTKAGQSVTPEDKQQHSVVAIQGDKLVLSEWCKQLFPKAMQQPILAYAQLIVETGFAAIFKEDGTFRDEIVKFLKTWPLTNFNEKTAINDPNTYMALASSALTYCSTPALSNIEHALQSKYPTEDITEKNEFTITQLIPCLDNNIITALLPLYIETQLESIKKNQIQQLQTACDNYLQNLNEAILVQLQAMPACWPNETKMQNAIDVLSESQQNSSFVEILANDPDLIQDNPKNPKKISQLKANLATYNALTQLRQQSINNTKLTDAQKLQTFKEGLNQPTLQNIAKNKFFAKCTVGPPSKTEGKFWKRNKPQSKQTNQPKPPPIKKPGQPP